MKALLDADIAEEITQYTIGSHGYPRFGDNILIHRYVAEKVLGRSLTDKEQVHHINRNKLDNRRVNLVICPDQKYHKHLHTIMDALDMGVSVHTHKHCSYHNQYEPRENFSSRPSSYDGLHNMCREATNNYRAEKGYKTVFDWKVSMNQQFRRAVKKWEVSCLPKEGRGQ